MWGQAIERTPKNRLIRYNPHCNEQTKLPSSFPGRVRRLLAWAATSPSAFLLPPNICRGRRGLRLRPLAALLRRPGGRSEADREHATGHPDRERGGVARACGTWRGTSACSRSLAWRVVGACRCGNAQICRCGARGEGSRHARCSRQSRRTGRDGGCARAGSLLRLSKACLKPLQEKRV